MAVVARSLIFLVFLIGIVQGRILSLNSSDDQLISDGIENQESYVKTNTLNSGPSIPNSCDHMYGFLPCAENAGGYIFQIVASQILLMFGENQISSGSKVLFKFIGDEKFGGIIFRILMALPSMAFMIVSGIFSANETAQSQVSVGVSIYAGTTVFSLTIQWGICVIFGRTDLKKKSDENGETSHSNCLPAKEKLMILKDSGVVVDDKTRDTARIMLLFLIPFSILQLVDFFINTSSGKHILKLIALVVSSLCLLSYIIYQIRDPWMQKRSLKYSKYEILQIGFLEHLKRHGQLVDENGKINTEAIEKLFVATDKDHDERITQNELEHLVVDIIRTGKITIDKRFGVSEVMKAFDYNKSGGINKAEFINGCEKWIHETNQSSETSDSTSRDIFHEIVWKEEVNDVWILITSVFQVILGIAILTFFGGPLMVTNILQLSYGMRLKSFIISFVVVPSLMNARAALSSLFPASKKDEESASLTFSEIYGGIIMNNIVGFTALLAIVYAKDLTWEFSAEVVIILVVCAIIGILAYRCTTYPLWTCILAFVLYLLSLVFLYFYQGFLSQN